jgi:hypothetical protein
MQDTHERTPQETEEPKCQVCEASFKRKTKKGVYCSPKCRQAAFFQKRHDFLELFLQIRKEFKSKTDKYTNKKHLNARIDELTNEWAEELRLLIAEAEKDPTNVAND